MAPLVVVVVVVEVRWCFWVGEEGVRAAAEEPLAVVTSLAEEARGVARARMMKGPRTVGRSYIVVGASFVAVWEIVAYELLI